jgi:hypothetical protein
MSLRAAELRGIRNLEQFPNRRLVREEIYYTVWFNQPVGLAIRRRIYAPLCSSAELYQIFVSGALFEPEQNSDQKSDGVLNQTFE